MDKRMAGDYEIIHAFHIGDQEVVLGENPKAVPEERRSLAPVGSQASSEADN